jgi:uncharacterized protein YbjT (DUF2867 family)
MKNVLILGANGNLARKVIDLLSNKDDIQLTLFVRRAGRLRNLTCKNCSVIEGDALNFINVKKAVREIDIVYVNLAGDLETMSKNIIKAMKETGVKRIIAISSIGIYETPLRPALKPYRKLADIIEASDLEYTILRPTWFTDTDEVDYEITRKGEAEKGSVISQKSLATFITEIIKSPNNYVRENLGINKPNS